MKSNQFLYIIVSVLALYSCAGESTNNDMATEASESAIFEDNTSEEIYSAVEEPNSKLTPVSNPADSID